MQPQLGIIGTGLIGTSLIDAAIEADAVASVLIFDCVADHEAQVVARYPQVRKADRPADLIHCDIVFLCTPPGDIAHYALSFAGEKPVVVDVGSVKSAILDAVRQGGGNPRFVPGHPLSGGTAIGPGGSNASIITRRPFVLTPCAETDMAALAAARAFLERIGATVILIDPMAHDRIMALVSHLPHLLAFSLIGALEGLPVAERKAALALLPNSFCTITKFALADAELWSDVFDQNRIALRSSLDELARFALELSIQSGDGLQKSLERLRETRLRLQGEE